MINFCTILYSYRLNGVSFWRIFRKNHMSCLVLNYLSTFSASTLLVEKSFQRGMMIILQAWHKRLCQIPSMYYPKLYVHRPHREGVFQGYIQTQGPYFCSGRLPVILGNDVLLHLSFCISFFSSNRKSMDASFFSIEMWDI